MAEVQRNFDDDDLKLAAALEFDAIVRIAWERAFPGKEWAEGNDRFLCEVLDVNGFIAHFERLLMAADVNLADSEKLKRVALNRFLLAQATEYGKTSVNLLGSRWTVAGDGGKGSVKIVDQSGNVLAESPAGGGLIIMDAASDLWDDLAECYRACAQNVAKGHQNWFTYFRLAAITAVCVLEAYINGLADDYLGKTKEPDKSILDELRGKAGASRVSLREKLRDWPKVFNTPNYPQKGGIWDDGVWADVEALITLRDTFVHNKKRAAALPTGEFSLPFVMEFAVVVNKAVQRIGKNTYGIPDWIRRNREVYKPFEKQAPQSKPAG